MPTLIPQTDDGSKPSHVTMPDSAMREMRTKRVSTGSILAGLIGNITVTWDTAFADANYTICPAVQTSGLSVLQIDSIVSFTASGCVIAVKNVSLLANTGTIHIIALHDL